MVDFLMANVPLLITGVIVAVCVVVLQALAKWFTAGDDGEVQWARTVFFRGLWCTYAVVMLAVIVVTGTSQSVNMVPHKSADRKAAEQDRLRFEQRVRDGAE